MAVKVASRKSSFLNTIAHNIITGGHLDLYKDSTALNTFNWIPCRFKNTKKMDKLYYLCISNIGLYWRFELYLNATAVNMVDLLIDVKRSFILS